MLILLISTNVLLLVLIVLYLFRRNNGSEHALKEQTTRIESVVKDEISRNREEFSKSAGANREELASSFKSFNDSLLSRMTETASFQTKQQEVSQKQISELTHSNEGRLDKLREVVETQLKSLQEDTPKNWRKCVKP